MKNDTSRIVEKSFKKFLDQDPDADDFQGRMQDFDLGV